MQYKAATIEEYIEQLPEDRAIAIGKLRNIFKKKLPKGFSECLSYGMIGYVVPHKLYPKGYHCNPELPLPFINLANQKNAVTLYHMGVYADPELLSWFKEAYSKQSKTKPDMGKSCIRFKKTEDIPFGLIEELAGKMSPQDWISLYEKNYKK